MPSLIAGYHSFVHSFICTNSYLRRAQRSGTVLGMGKTGVNRTDGSSPRGVCSLLRWGCTIRDFMCLFTLPSPLLPRTHTQYVRLQHVPKGKGETTQSDWKAACLYQPKCAQTFEFGTAAERDQSLWSLRKPIRFFQAGPAFQMHPFDRHVSVLVLVGNKNFNPMKVTSESAHCPRGFSRYMAH